MLFALENLSTWFAIEVALSHVHAATMSVFTGENVRASQRLQTLKWFLLYAALIEYFSCIYRWHECMFTVSCGYNAFNVYRRELAPGTVSLTGDMAQGDDSKHWAYSRDPLYIRCYTLL